MFCLKSCLVLFVNVQEPDVHMLLTETVGTVAYSRTEVGQIQSNQCRAAAFLQCFYRNGPLGRRGMHMSPAHSACPPQGVGG